MIASLLESPQAYKIPSSLSRLLLNAEGGETVWQAAISLPENSSLAPLGLSGLAAREYKSKLPHQDWSTRAPNEARIRRKTQIKHSVISRSFGPLFKAGGLCGLKVAPPERIRSGREVK